MRCSRQYWRPKGIMEVDGHFALPQLRKDPVMPIRSAPQLTPSRALESLLYGYQQADEEATRDFIEKVSPLLLRYFWAQEFNRRFAEDLVQETWMRIHKARHSYRRGEPVLPWIFAIARHTGLDNYRRTRRIEARTEQVNDWPNAAVQVTHEEPG